MGREAVRVAAAMNASYFVLPLALLCLASVDGGRSEPVSLQEPASFVAPEDKALVVFARPRALGKAVNFYIFNEDKELVTLFKGKEYASIAVEPGKHTIYVVSENAELVRADLAAGRTYLVLTDPKMGGGKARVRVEVAKRNSPSFAESTEWLSKCKPGEPDFKKGNKWTSKHQDALRRRMTAAEEDWAKMDEKEREAITLRPEDGRTAEEAKQLESR
jgi:hypothetical protein